MVKKKDDDKEKEKKKKYKLVEDVGPDYPPSSCEDAIESIVLFFFVICYIIDFIIKRMA